MSFAKYMHLERYGNDEVEGITEGIVYAFPKLDGTNGQLWSTANWREAVVERGYGLYCPVDGHFAFKGECDN